jgi:deoxycytidine triphosphate deaminase
LRAPGVVDASNPSASIWVPTELASATLRPGEFFLGQTRERIAISNRIFGQLHTRSRWARLGLDCLGSSTYVSPGFGAGEAIPLVLEITTKISISIADDDPIAALVLFEIDRPVRASPTEHKDQFPLLGRP